MQRKVRGCQFYVSNSVFSKACNNERIFMKYLMKYVELRDIPTPWCCTSSHQVYNMAGMLTYWNGNNKCNSIKDQFLSDIYWYIKKLIYRSTDISMYWQTRLSTNQYIDLQIYRRKDISMYQSVKLYIEWPVGVSVYWCISLLT